MTSSLTPAMRWLAEWDQAACLGMDTNLFLPDNNTGRQYNIKVARAKQICRTCPIQRKCLDYALKHCEEGIWGGTTEKERAQLLAIRKQFFGA